MLYEPLSIEERVAELEKFLMWNESIDKPPTEVKVYHYNAEGFRIAEISYTWRHSKGCNGASYMRSEPECSAVILAAEDFVTWYNEEKQLFEEAQENLKYLTGRL